MIKRVYSIALILIMAMVLIACDEQGKTPTLEPEPSSEETVGQYDTIEEKVDFWLRTLTLEEKVGQMMQGERSNVTVQDVRDYGIGSILSGGGSLPPQNTLFGWKNMVNNYQNAARESSSGIPLIYGVDAVHGHNNVMNSTIFPHNIGLGAANDPDLMERIGEVVAKEVALSGVHWNFAPTLATVQDIRWGRTYEGFSENPEIVERLIVPYIDGLQMYNIAATAKHYIGDGNTEGGIDRGNATLSEAELREHLLPAYQKAVDTGVKTIMVSYSSFQGTKMHENKYLITDVLKGELEFSGIVISDWEAINEVTGISKKAKVINAVNSGIDMLMEPNDWKNVHQYIVEAVNANAISMARIDDAVGRILTVKYEIGLFEEAARTTGGLRDASSLEVAQEAVSKSLVLLKNDNHLLPLEKNKKILVVGPGSDNIGVQSGGWTIHWQGGTDANLTEGTTIKEGFETVLTQNGGTLYTDMDNLNDADIVVLVLAEKPYTEGVGDNATLELDSHTGFSENIHLINQLKASGKPVVTLLVAGRPMLVDDYISDWDAFVMAWLPGTEGAGVTDVLFGDVGFSGKLPFTWPKDISQANHSSIQTGYDESLYQFPYGFGLEYGNSEGE